MKSLVGLCQKPLFDLFFQRVLVVRNVYNIARPIKSIKRMRGKPPYKTKTLAQTFEEYNYKDPAIYYKVDIGLPRVIQSKTDTLQNQTAHFKKLREDPELEKKARGNQISLCLDDVTKEWIQESSSEHIKIAAEHYGVFQDLFGDAFFYPQVHLDVAYKHSDFLVPVFRGNTLKPNMAVSEPMITYKADPDSLWTLVVTNPDCHLVEENAECLHWFVGNIAGNNLNQSEVVADYIQPFPARGTGFHRFIFILYKQTEKIDYSSLKLPSKEVNISSRTFKTYDFYKKHQDQLTPAGLVFCQIDWDHSVSKFFHTVLEIEEPIYEYDFDPPFLPRQKKYPIGQPFNLYMDRYRDPKQIAKEYLLRKFKNRHPFEIPKTPLRFPNAVPVEHDLNERIFGKIPSWLKREKLKQRLGYGRINDY